MKNPWMKFYPADWRSDPALRMCSLTARGLWVEMLCVMHEAEPYGHLLVAGKSPSPQQLSVLLGADLKTISAALAELVEAGVVSQDGQGVYLSRRMVRDAEKAERDKANGKGGGNPTLKRGVNPPDKPKVDEGDKAQKPEARDQRKEEAHTAAAAAFERAWAAYPKRSGGNSKADALKAFTARMAAGVDPESMIAGTIRYAAFVRAKGDEGGPYVKQGATFYGPGGHFAEDWEPPKSAAVPKTGFDQQDYLVDTRGNAIEKAA